MTKVLFQNRPDAIQRWGGDTTQMLKTKEFLTALGVDVDISLELEPNLEKYDIVHIFNIQTSNIGIHQLNNAKRKGVPIALSPIYWDKRHIESTNNYFKYHHSSLIRTLAKVDNRIPYFILNHAGHKSRNLILSAATDMLRGADILLPNSFAELESIAILFELPNVRSKAEIVPNGITVDFSADQIDLDIELPDQYVLEVGRFEPVKNQLGLIQSLMHDKDIPLVFIGDCLDSIYGNDCRVLGKMRGNTFFLPKVPHDQLNTFYRRAKVHALPSLRESPGLSTLEAAIQGANCVVSIHGPVAEYFGDSVWYCDPADLDSIRQAVKLAWDAKHNPALKERAISEFTWEKAAIATHKAYKRLLSTIR